MLLYDYRTKILAAIATNVLDSTNFSSSLLRPLFFCCYGLLTTEGIMIPVLAETEYSTVPRTPPKIILNC